MDHDETLPYEPAESGLTRAAVRAAGGRIRLGESQDRLVSQRELATGILR